MASFLAWLSDWLVSLNMNWWQSLIFFVIVAVIVFLFNMKKDAPIWNILNNMKQRKRRCIDCVGIIMSKREKMEIELSEYTKKQAIIENSLLKKQMNFAEQKLSEIETMFLDFYNSKIFNSVADNKTQTTQYRMFWGLIRDALYIRMKDEIRRSFKENGFYHKSGSEFQIYVREQHKNIFGILKQHVINLYPSNIEDLVVNMNEIVKFIVSKKDRLEDIAFEIYTSAKEIKKKIEEDIKELEYKYLEKKIQFNLEVDNIVKEK